jgi:hypothetical protein
LPAPTPPLPPIADCEITEVRVSTAGLSVHLTGEIHGVRELSTSAVVGLIDLGCIREDLAHLEWMATQPRHAEIMERAGVSDAVVLAFISAWSGAPVLELVLASPDFRLE